MEIERVQNECSLADIDFEFVIDSSSSVGSRNWQITMNYIAQYWIQEKSYMIISGDFELMVQINQCFFIIK